MCVASPTGQGLEPTPGVREQPPNNPNLGARQHTAAVVEFDLLWSSLNVVEVDADIIDRASQLADVHALRGDDAVHLAAALITGADLFASADRRLCLAARNAGIHVL